MTTWMRRRVSAEEGMTLVELLVAFVVLAITLTALASTIITSLAAVSRDEKRVRATQLANQALEDLRGLDWDDVGFYSNDAGYQSSFDGNLTVNLGSDRPDGSLAPLPVVEGIDRDGVDFTVTTNVFWLGEGTQALKGFHVLVEWDDRGRPFAFESSSSRAPTLGEVGQEEDDDDDESPTTFEILDYSISPTLVTISPMGLTEQEIYLSVTTTQPANTLGLVVKDLGGAVVFQTTFDPEEGSDRTRWSVVIPSSKPEFKPEPHVFKVSAYGVNGRISIAEKPMAFVRPNETLVEVMEPTLPATSQFCVQNNGIPWQPIVVAFEARGVGLDDQGSISWTSQPGEEFASEATPTETGVRFTTLIPETAQFTEASTTVTVRATRTVDSVSAAEPYVYEIVRTSSSEACP